MKTTFKLNDIKLGEMTIGNVEVSTEYSVQDISGVYSLVRTAIKEAPETMADLANAYNAYEQINEITKQEELKRALVKMIRGAL